MDKVVYRRENSSLYAKFGHAKLSKIEKQEFHRTDFGSRLLAAEGTVAVRVRGVSEVKQYPSGSG